MVLVGEIILYVGCMGLSAVVTRITILSFCLNRNQALQDAQENNGYTLIEDEEIPVRPVSSAVNSEDFIDLFSPRPVPVFRNNFEVPYYSADRRSSPIRIRSESESIDLEDSFLINFEPFIEESNEDSEEELNLDLGIEEEEEEEEEEERKELTPAMDLDASKFDSFSEDSNFYYAKEYYFGLAMTNNLTLSS